MAGSLPTVGVLRYNGYDFGATTETVGVTVTPKYDGAGRTASYNRFVFRFSTHIKGAPTTPSRADAPLNPEALAARRALSKPAGEFVYQGRGFVDLHVNRPGGSGVRDVVWGPKPLELSLAYAGGGGCVLAWSLEVCAPDCADAVYQFSPMEFSFAVSYGRLPDGRVTRQTSGYLTVPMTRDRADGRTITGSADDYRERVVGRLPVGFDRRYEPFRVDAAKTRLDFGYTDEEMPANVPPPGVIRAEAQHDVSSGIAGLKSWQGFLQASYTLDARTDPRVAVYAFWALLKDRLATLAKAKSARPPGAAPSQSMRGIIEDIGNVGKTIIPTLFRMSEPKMYGERVVTLALGYSFTASLGQVLAGSGLWRPVPDSNWRVWEASLRNTYLHPLGAARLRFDARDDQLVDLCREPDASPGALAGVLPFVAFRDAAADRTVSQLIASTFPTPKPDESWLHYECEIFVEADGGGVPVRLLPTPKTGSSELTAGVLFGGTGDAAGPAPDALGPGVGRQFLADAAPPVPPATEVRFVRRGQDVTYVVLTGWAARAGYPVTCPRLDTVGGVKAEPCNRPDRGEGTRQKIVAMAGLPVYVGAWKLRYALPEPPRTVPVPPNPFFGDGNPQVPQ